MTIVSLKKRAERSFNKKDATWDHLHKNAIELMYPPRRTNRFDHGGKHDMFANTYDSTATQAIDSLANSMVASLTPAWTAWGAYAPSANLPKEQKGPLAEALRKVNIELFQHIRDSNFVRAIRPTFVDLLFGTAAIITESDGGTGLNYRNVPIEAMAFDVTYNGDPWYTYHRDEMRLDEMIAKWGDKAPMLQSTEIQDILASEPDRMVKFIVAVEPQDATKPKTKFDVTAYTVELGTDTIELDKYTKTFNPYTIARWALVAGSAYGFGPAITEYADARYLNKIQEIGLKAGILSINPPHLSSDGEIINNKTVKFAPGAIIPVDSTERSAPSLVPYPIAGDVRMLDYEVTRRREDIRKAFHADRFGPPSGTPMTAAEVLERNNLINQELGATVALLESDLQVPLMVKSTIQLSETGATEVRARMKAVLNFLDETQIIFLSQLAQAQRTAEVDQIMNFATIALQLGQVDDAAKDLLNISGAVTQIGEHMQIPDNVMRPEAEAAAITKQRRDQQAQMAQAALQQSGIGGNDAGQPGPGPAQTG